MTGASPEDLDAAVLSGLRSGDVGALEACYRLHGARVYRLCRAMLGERCDAEDATQEVFLKVHERAHQFEERARFSTWLHRLTLNHCLHRLEHRARRRAEALDEHLVDAGPTPVEACQRAEASTHVEQLLAQLPPPQRAVLALRELEELAYADIAEVLGVPVGTVMSRLSRAREKLVRHVSSATEQRALPPPCPTS